MVWAVDERIYYKEHVNYWEQVRYEDIEKGDCIVWGYKNQDYISLDRQYVCQQEQELDKNKLLRSCMPMEFKDGTQGVIRIDGGKIKKAKVEYTRKNVEELKKSWAKDPIWDIYDTPGFEKYKDELKKFQEEKEKEWNQDWVEKEKKIDEKARELGLEGLYRLVLENKEKIGELLNSKQ